MRVVILSSGGKDSAAAFWWAQCRGWNVTHLVTVRINGADSMMFQLPGTDLVEYQAKLAGVQWLAVESEGIAEQEVDDLQMRLEELDFDGLVCGALRSDYQKSRIERMCERIGVKSFTPLWHQDAYSHLSGMVQNGFEIMITGVSAEGLGEEWLGHIITTDSLLDLEKLSQKYRFNIDGEGGEYESIVVAGPHHKGRLLLENKPVWDGVRGHLIVTRCSTEP
mgnify:FL=1